MLSPHAEQRIKEYLNLPYPGISGIRCPYYNNARLRRRGELRALVGKGTPGEIMEEAMIVARQMRTDFFRASVNTSFTAEDIRHFLIDRGLGIECSGFVTQVLDQHFEETRGIELSKKFFIAPVQHPWRWLMAKLRPVENISVRTYTDDRNTTVVARDGIGWNYGLLQPGDVITILETGPRKNRNHILLITETDGTTMHYVHARAWASEGQYGHGVMEGTIEVINPGKHLKEQRWTEKNMTGKENETWQEIAEGRVVEIRRIRI